MDKKREINGEVMEDSEIIDLFWSRNEKAIHATDAKYGKYLYSIAYNIVHDDLDCEECLNDTYLGTWNRIPPIRPTVFQIFLSKIMRNIAVDKFRKKSASKRIPSEMTVSLEELDECFTVSQELEDEVLLNELGTILNEFLRELSQKEATIFISRYYYYDSIDSICKMMKTSESTVFRALTDMKKRLSKKLTERGYAI